MGRIFRLRASNWATVLMALFIAGIIFLLIFTTALFTVFVGAILLLGILFAFYYVGVRVDHALRYGRRPKRPAGDPSGSSDGGSAAPAGTSGNQPANSGSNGGGGGSNDGGSQT